MYAICCKVVVYGYLHKTVSAGAALKIYNGKHKKPEIMYSFRPLRYILWLDEMGMTGFACLDAIRHGIYRILVLYCNVVFSKGFNFHIDLCSSLSCAYKYVNEYSSPQCMTTPQSAIAVNNCFFVLGVWR